MQEEFGTRVAAGNDALARGEWAAARDAFEAVLEHGELAEACYGLGAALWWLGDMPGTMANFERAYAAFRKRPDPLQAALVALRIGFHSLAHLANGAAAAGWIARGRRLIEEHELEEIRGELLLMEACTAADPAAGEAAARAALDSGRRGGDADLELCSLSALGMALVEQGRATEGLALLDEALAGSLGGEGARLDTVVFASCNMIVSCARCASFERATQWIRAAERFVERYGCPFLYTDCRVVYGRVLLATGDWAAAEAELKAAMDLARASVPSYYMDAAAALAELRLLQGRVEEAERLIAGFEGHPPVVPVLARIQLRTGGAALAVATVRRRLDVIGGSGLERAELLEVLGEACLAAEDAASALGHAAALARLGADHDCRVIVARGERLHGRGHAAADAAAARPRLDAALQEFVQLGMPYEAARTRILLAEVLRDTEPAAAEAEARTALACFEELGAAADADAAAALLRSLGVPPARAGGPGAGPLTKREHQVLALLAEGLSNPEIAARLFISRKTVEHHVAHVLAKLGLRSRAEAAAVAARRLAGSPPGNR